jgi:PAS domain S-box-containing protein
VDDVNLIRTIGAILLSALDRQRAEKAVRRSEERFRRLFEAELIGMFFADMYGNITEANVSFLRITGLEPTDLPLMSDALTPHEWRRHDEASLLRLLKDGIDRPWEKEFLHKDGHRIPILIGGAVMTYDRGECVYFILDLSDQKRAEQKIHQLNAELERTARLGVMGEMAAGLAHEVHQPLAAISNYATGARERLARGRLTSDALDQVFAEIAEQCGRAGSVIRNIREFVRNRNPVTRPVDLNAVVRDCLRLLRFEVRQRDVVVQSELDEELPPVLTDVTQLSQVLLNLMLNGLQAMEGTVQPRTLSVKTSQADEVVLVEIGDSGCGIAPDVETRLFDQFFTTKPDGLGMGLPISRSIMESHGGRLELANTGASGTTFVLRLPAASGQEMSGLPRSPFDAAMS